MVLFSFIKNTILKAKHSQRLSQLLVLVSFLITFLITRSITYAPADIRIPNFFNDIHIHHMVPGILLLIISGFVGLSFWTKPHLRLSMSILFGTGAALTIDEFALWLFLKDVYWEKEGRISIDAMIIFTVFLMMVFLISEVHDHIWIKKAKKSQEDISLLFNKQKS